VVGSRVKMDVGKEASETLGRANSKNKNALTGKVVNARVGWQKKNMANKNCGECIRPKFPKKGETVPAPGEEKPERDPPKTLSVVGL